MPLYKEMKEDVYRRNLPEEGLSEYLVQYTHAGHNWLPLVPFF